MAQQTQLARVVPAYRRFLARFPTPAACASSPLGDVLRAWEGLGYNRRARNLHRAALAVVHHHQGRLPASLHELLALPGVGPYTARAVMAFAFEADVGVVDTNAGRVLSRAVAGRPLRPREAQELVDLMVPAGAGWRFGQALLDLGAELCVPGAPDATTVRSVDGAVGPWPVGAVPILPWARPVRPPPRVGSTARTGRAGDVWSLHCGWEESLPEAWPPPADGPTTPLGRPAWWRDWWPRVWPSPTARVDCACPDGVGPCATSLLLR